MRARAMPSGLVQALVHHAGDIGSDALEPRFAAAQRLLAWRRSMAAARTLAMPCMKYTSSGVKRRVRRDMTPSGAEWLAPARESTTLMPLTAPCMSAGSVSANRGHPR